MIGSKRLWFWMAVIFAGLSFYAGGWPDGTDTDADRAKRWIMLTLSAVCVIAWVLVRYFGGSIGWLKVNFGLKLSLAFGVTLATYLVGILVYLAAVVAFDRVDLVGVVVIGWIGKSAIALGLWWAAFILFFGRQDILFHANSPFTSLLTNTSSSAFFKSIVLAVVLFGGGSFCFTAHQAMDEGLYDLSGRSPFFKTFSILMGTASYLALVPPSMVVLRDWISESRTFRDWFVVGTGANSRMSGLRHYASHNSIIEEDAECGKQTDEVYIGKSLFSYDFVGRHISHKSETHLVTIAGSGAGKSVTAIWPNLAMNLASMFVIDPKGEHAKRFYYRRGGRNTYDARTWEVGNDVKPLSSGPMESILLDPFEVCPDIPSDSYNLLSEIDPEDPDARFYVDKIAKGCVEVSGAGQAKFWEEAGHKILMGSIAHVLTTQPVENRNIPFVADMLTGINPETGFADPSYFEEVILDMRTNQSMGRLVQGAASAFDDLGENAAGAIKMETEQALGWCKDPRMREHLCSVSCPKLASIADPGVITTLFVCIPFKAINDQRRWLRCLTTLLLAFIEGRPQKPEPPVLFILDELPQYGKQLECLKESVLAARGSGIRLWAIAQDLSSLEDCLGESGAKSFMGSSSKQFFGCDQLETAEHISKLLGNHQGKGSYKAEIADAKEIMSQMNVETPRQYYFPITGEPMYLERLAYNTNSMAEEKGWRSLKLTRHYS